MKKALLFLLCSFPAYAQPQFALRAGSSVSVSTSATLLTAADDSTKWLLIQNTGTTSIVCIGPSTVTASTGVCLNPATASTAGGAILFDVSVPTNALYAISASGTNAVLIQKGDLK